jgi:hypothetical protein
MPLHLRESCRLQWFRISPHRGPREAVATSPMPRRFSCRTVFLGIAHSYTTVAYMMGMTWNEGRRRGSPRVGVETFCSEFQQDTMQHAIVTDLSATGLRILRPPGKSHGLTIPIEFEIPEVDEVVWALGEVCFDQVTRAPAGCTIGIAGLVRSTGVRLIGAAERHKRLLREYVMDTWRELDADINDNWLMAASCYRS